MSARHLGLWALALSACVDSHTIDDSRDVASDDMTLTVASLGTAQGTTVTVFLSTFVPARFPLALHAPDDTLVLAEEGGRVIPFTLGESSYQATTPALDGPWTVRLERRQDRSIAQVVLPPPSFALTAAMTTDGGEDALGVSWSNAQPGYRSTLTVAGPCLTKTLTGELVSDTGARQIRRSELGFASDPAGCVLRVSLCRDRDALVVERATELTWTTP